MKNATIIGITLGLILALAVRCKAETFIANNTYCSKLGLWYDKAPYPHTEFCMPLHETFVFNSDNLISKEPVHYALVVDANGANLDIKYKTAFCKVTLRNKTFISAQECNEISVLSK